MPRSFFLALVVLKTLKEEWQDRLNGVSKSKDRPVGEEAGGV